MVKYEKNIYTGSNDRCLFDFIQGGIIMETADYLNQLLRKYSGTFDLYQPYVIHGKEYPAYGYFFSHTEKYVLVREANMWSADSYEHVLFITAQEVDQALIEEAEALVRNYMEPVLVPFIDSRS